MSPTLCNPIVKEILEEILKKRFFEPGHNNFLKIQPLIFAGKECLAAFIELLREVKSVTMFSTHVSFELRNSLLSSESFPLGLWKKMALFIPQLIISDFDEAYQMSMITMMEHSTRLGKIEANFDLIPEAWQSLLNSTVKDIAAPFRSLIDIGTLDEHLYANIESVEAFSYIGDPALFQEFLINFRIPCRSLKLQRIESWVPFWEVINSNLDRVISLTVEKLKIVFSVNELPSLVELNLANNLEAIQLLFPNLKELEMKIKIDDNEDNQIFGNNFVPHFEFLQLAVNELTNQIEQSNIQYKLLFHYCRTEYIDWPNDNVVQMEDDFHAMNFVKEKESGISQKWIHETEVSESKNVFITFYLDELDTNSELYDDIIDDLDIGNFYNYGDGDYEETDHDDANEEGGLDSDYY